MAGNDVIELTNVVEDLLYLAVIRKAIISIASKANSIQESLDEFIGIQLATRPLEEVYDIVFNGSNLLTRTEIDSFATFAVKSYDNIIDGAWGEGMNVQQATTNKLYNWRNRSGNECPDCLDRATWEAMTLKEWELVGLPRQGVTLCRSNCKCILDSTAKGTLEDDR